MVVREVRKRAGGWITRVTRVTRVIMAIRGGGREGGEGEMMTQTPGSEMMGLKPPLFR